jgi:hypothetical protein
MKLRPRIVSALLSSLFACAVAFASPGAAASTNTTEITDMWFNPAEAGWGVNMILQNNVAFMTFFIYDENRNPVWYTAELHFRSGFEWSGLVYASGGPWFGGTFPPAGVTIRQAGTATFSMAANNLDHATLTYVIDGVSVTKSLQRQFWTYENYSRIYAGGYSVRSTRCVPGTPDGIEEVTGILEVNQNGESMSMNAVAAEFSCSFIGTYSQQGKLGRVDGNYACTDTRRGSFTMSDMTPTVSGFTGHIEGQNQFCQWSGFFGGITREQ